MKERGENTWLKNLPVHTPPEDMWEGIENRLDNGIASEHFRAQLAGLPVHEPPYGLWASIEKGIASRRVKQLGLIASGIAATLLLAFILKGVLLTEPMRTESVGSLAKAQKETRSPEIKTSLQAQTVVVSVPAIKKIDKRNEMPFVKAAIYDNEHLLSSAHNHNKYRVISILSDSSGPEKSDYSIVSLKMKSSEISGTAIDIIPPAITATFQGKDIQKKDTISTWLLASNPIDDYPPPPNTAVTNNRKGISIGFNWLPEPTEKSVYGSSTYQTFALMAQYQLPSVELRTGLGISYQSAPMGYKTDYSFLDHTFGSGKDTILNAGSIDITGKERSSFLYYSIGAGKQIYSNKRISTSLRVGAGFSLLLANKNELSGPVYNTIRKQSNTSLNNTESNIPDINQTRFDLVTGFDFNYRLIKRWSLSIEPTLKYYFNPVYSGSAARSFSTGLRTGILFKL